MPSSRSISTSSSAASRSRRRGSASTGSTTARRPFSRGTERHARVQTQGPRELARKIDHDTLSRDGKIDYEIFRHHLARDVWLAETFRPFEDDPRIYGDYSDRERLPAADAVEPAARDQPAATPWPGWPRSPGWSRPPGKTIGRPPRVKVETAIRQTKGAIDFYKGDLFTLAGATRGQGSWAAPARRSWRHCEDYLGFLEAEVLPRSTESWRIGPEQFARKLDLELDAGLSADEVLREAEAEASRVEREMAVIARQLWGTTLPRRADPPRRRRGPRDA